MEILTRTKLKTDELNCGSKICFFCKKAASYRCPRCNYCYCSETCYKSADHRQCSESFYRDECIQALRGRQCDDDDKRKIMEILKREKEKFMDENFYTDLNENENEIVNLKDESAVNDEELRKFESFVSTGQISQFVNEWKPWWDIEPTIVDDCDDLIPSLKGQLSSLSVPEFKQLCKANPHLSVPYSVLALALSYVGLQRKYLGDFEDNCIEVTEEFLLLCPALFNGVIFSSLDVALSSVVKQFSGRNLFPLQVSVWFLDDLIRLLHGPCITQSLSFIRLSLFHCLTLFRCCMQNLKAVTDEDWREMHLGMNTAVCSLKEFHKNVKHAKRKLFFYLSWLNSFGDCLYSFNNEIKLIQVKLLEELDEFQRSLSEVTEKLKTTETKFVEEI